jgi:hypothetical protein
MSGLLGLWGNEDAQAAMNALKQNQSIYGNIQNPDLQWTNYNPDTYNADMMTNAQTVQEDPTLVSDQMNALKQMSGLSQNGLSDVDQAAYQKARDEAAQIGKSQSDAAISNAESRGIAGSGQELAMREMASQNASNSAQNADLQQAADAAKMRAMYTQAYGNAASQARSQDDSVKSTNANILNSFNAANTSARNQANMYNTQQQNYAQQYNNQGKLSTAQQNYEDQLQKAAGQAGANSSMAQGYAAQDAASTAQWNQLLGMGATLGAGYMAGRNNSSGEDEGYAHGGVIPGIPRVPGDSPVNDTVKINASPGEIVIPRSHAASPLLAKAFVDHLFGKVK